MLMGDVFTWLVPVIYMLLTKISRDSDYLQNLIIMIILCKPKLRWGMQECYGA